VALIANGTTESCRDRKQSVQRKTPFTWGHGPNDSFAIENMVIVLRDAMRELRHVDGAYSKC